MKRIAMVCACAFVYALTTAVPADAQSFADKGPHWWFNMERQLVESMDLPIDQVREQTLQHIVYFATNYPDKLDLTPAIPALLNVYERGNDLTHRTMALVALHAIGNEQSMERLAELVKTESSDRIHTLTLAVLNQYYNSRGG